MISIGHLAAHTLNGITLMSDELLFFVVPVRIRLSVAEFMEFKPGYMW